MHDRPLLWLCATCFVATLFISSAVAGTEEYRFERMWPALQQPWYFLEHNDLAVDEDGSVYVISSRANVVDKFDAQGRFLLRWGAFGAAPGQLNAPFSIAASPEGVYVADTENHRIQRFSKNGEFEFAWGARGGAPGQFRSPSGLRVATDGNVYVSDTLNHRIQVFTSAGDFIREWGSNGSAPGFFSAQRALAIGPENRIYVADLRNNRIQVFSADGSFLRMWGTGGTQQGQFAQPKGIAVDATGVVYVADSENHRIQKFSETGDLLEVFGGRGQGPGEYFSPRGLCMRDDATLYVADFWNDRIQTITLEGTPVAQWGSLGNGPGRFFAPEAMVFSGDELFVSDTWNNRIQVFNEDGVFQRAWGDPGSGPGQLNLPVGIALDADNNLIIADSANHRLQRFTATGDFVDAWGGAGTSEGEFTVPLGVAVGADELIYVTDGETVQNDRVQVFDAAGQFVRKWGSHGSAPGQLIAPKLLSVAPDGSILVADSGNHRVQRFSATGEFLEAWGENGSGAGQFRTPWSAIADAEGRVFVADFANHRIQWFDPGGNFAGAYGALALSPDGLSFPISIDFAPGGGLFVLNEGFSRVQKLRKVLVRPDAKAIIVSGGGPFPGNDLLDTTRACANFAYQVLNYQGLGRDDIDYLSFDLGLDLDGNALADDIDADVTAASLQHAIERMSQDAGSLLLYLVDHGGEGTFRMSGTETLSSAMLASWLATAQANMSGPIVVVYDACRSGSFLETLSAPNRVVIASSAADESAYFLDTGTISFSNFFWTSIFNGQTLAEAFSAAQAAISLSIGFQSPQMSDPEGLAEHLVLGQGTDASGELPRFVSASATPAAAGGADFSAEVEDEEGISRVWAVLRAAQWSAPGADSAVLDLPSVELLPAPGNPAFWSATYSGFANAADYEVTFYARDSVGNTSPPRSATINGAQPPVRKALLIGGDATGRTQPRVQVSLQLAYEALIHQGYRDDDIDFFAPEAISTGWDGLNMLDNVRASLDAAGAGDVRDLTVCFAGDADVERLLLNADESINSEQLAAWLNAAQAAISGTLCVILDANHAGTMLPALASATGRGIIIASAGAQQAMCDELRPELSFSSYFWRRVLNGADVNRAFTHAAIAMEFGANGLRAELDDNGDGLFDPKTDGHRAARYKIGSGVLLGGDDPLVGEVAPEQTLEGTTSATVWADNVTTTGTIAAVYAVISLPEGSRKNACGGPATEVIELAANGPHYQATYNGFDTAGTYDVSIVAVDAEGAISLPEGTRVIQTADIPGMGDAFERDDTPALASALPVDGPAQHHTIHIPGDEDWARFFCLAGQIVTIETAELSAGTDTQLDLFDASGEVLLGSNDDRGPADLSSLLLFTVNESAYYLLRVSHADAAAGGDSMQYALRVLRETGPAVPGSLLVRVLDDATAAPVPAAIVRDVYGTVLGDTNERGELFVGQLDASSYQLQASAPGYDASPWIVAIVLTGNMSEIEFRLDPPGASNDTPGDTVQCRLGRERKLSLSEALGDLSVLALALAVLTASSVVSSRSA